MLMLRAWQVLALVSLFDGPGMSSIIETPKTRIANCWHVCFSDQGCLSSQCNIMVHMLTMPKQQCCKQRLQHSVMYMDGLHIFLLAHEPLSSRASNVLPHVLAARQGHSYHNNSFLASEIAVLFTSFPAKNCWNSLRLSL